jgi:hypothetical protein
MQFPHTDQRVYISVSPNAIGNIQRTLQLQAYLVGVGGLGLVGVGLLLLKLLLEILLPLPLHLLLPAAEPPARPRSNPNIISTEPKKWSTGRGFRVTRLGGYRGGANLLVEREVAGRFVAARTQAIRGTQAWVVVGPIRGGARTE